MLRLSRCNLAWSLMETAGSGFFAFQGMVTVVISTHSGLSFSLSLFLSLPLSLTAHRYTLLRHSKERQSLDGLNNLHYSPLVSRRPLYTNVSVSLSRQLAQIVDY